MRFRRHLTVAAVLTLTTVAFAQSTTRPASRATRFKPILTQQVVSRDSGGTRGGEFPWCDILVPTQTIATTTQTQPTLVWFVEGPLPYAYQCTIIDTTTDDSVTDAPLAIEPVTRGGWHTIDLAKRGVTLKPGVTYQWNFSIAVPKADAGKSDVEPHSTLIRVVPPTPEVAKAIAAATPADRIQVLADQGYWLDAAAAAVAADADARGAAESHQTLADLVDTFGRKKLAEKLAAGVK